MRGTTGGMALTVLIMTLHGCSAANQNSQTKEAWNPANDPAHFDVYTQQLDSLAREGMLPDAVYPWSDFYWATYTGGLAYRWQTSESGSSNYLDYRYTMMGKEQIAAMSQDERDKLSPAEKYDIAQGHYDFPLVQNEWQNQDSSRNEAGEVPTWYGLCHGWAPATLMEREPGPKAQITNPDGIKVNFFSGDMKAMLTKVYADAATASRMIGERCDEVSNKIPVDSKGRIKLDACRDVNPGSLHLVLTQLLGGADPAGRKGFVMDMTYDAEVWNQAVAGFNVVSYDASHDARAKYRAPGTTKIATVKTEVYYIREIAPSTTPEMGRKQEYTATMTLDYSLELDSTGKIIGGEWISTAHPDFLWLLTARPVLNAGPILSAEVFSFADASHQN